MLGNKINTSFYSWDGLMKYIITIIIFRIYFILFYYKVHYGMVIYLSGLR